MLDRQKHQLRHCIRTQQYTRKEIEELFDLTDMMRNGTHHNIMRGKRLASLFYEESTRTRFSCEAAAQCLGGQCISTENASAFSSVAKGESLEDTIRITGIYADVIVLRHPEEDAADRATTVATVPILNGGCGPNKDRMKWAHLAQHPSQALLDLYTIERERHTIDGTRIIFVGDLQYGRTVRSLAYLLGKYKGIRVTFVSPEAFRVNNDIKEYLERHNVEYHETGRLTPELLAGADVVYMTRIQKERLPQSAGIAHLRLMMDCTLTRHLTARLPKESIIMHPLPRNSELPPDIDSLPQAAYFRQAENGLYVRMALLYQMFA